MKSILIFDSLNDILYLRCDKSFREHIQQLAASQQLSTEEEMNDNEWINLNIVLQLFSPLITSQRVMTSHFSNGYSSIECEDGLNIMFDEYAGYLFLCISEDSKYWIKRQLAVCISFVKHICGHDISLLKSDKERSWLLGFLLDTWYEKSKKEQYMLIEAIQQMRLNSSLSTSIIKLLMKTTEKFKNFTPFAHSHALMLVDQKFLSLYSSRTASELSGEDILFLNIFGEVLKNPRFHDKNSKGTLSEMFSESSESLDTIKNDSFDEYSTGCSVLSDKEAENDGENCTNMCILLLSNQKPHAVLSFKINYDTIFFFIYELAHEQLNYSFVETLHSLADLHRIHVRCTLDRDVIQSSVDAVDAAIKKLNDSFKKKLPPATSKSCTSAAKAVVKKWEIIRKKYQEYLKSRNNEMLLKMDSTVDNVLSMTRNLYTSCMLDDSLVKISQENKTALLEFVKKTLAEITDVEKLKEVGSLNYGTGSISMNKFVEEFSGMVHFLYVDRTNHRVVTPNLDFSSPGTTRLTKQKIWSMVEFARSHLEDGHFALMWKDTVFNYSYFLWFEDKSGTPLKPKISPAVVVKNLSIPSVFNSDFYHQLIKKCFPSTKAEKIQCYEIYTIHLGLVTSSCALEHARRLTATIWEVTGVLNKTIDQFFWYVFISNLSDYLPFHISNVI